MKKLISICFLVFFVVIGNAQVNTKPKLNELSQDQLNLALAKSLKTIKTGKALIFIGVGLELVGAGILVYDLVDCAISTSSHNYKKSLNTAFVIGPVGAITLCVGIPVYLTGINNKYKINLELVKFNPKGSASINGIGLKIRF